MQIKKILIFLSIQSIITMMFAGKALARPGDFAVFREATGTDSLTATPLDMTWDTTVSDSSFTFTLQGNNSDIDLAETGHYLVLYNIWATEGSGGGTNRRSVSTWLSLDGTDLPIGRAGGYIRDGSGDLDAYPSGGAIIYASAGQDLQAHIVRTDTNPTATVDLRANVSGVSLLRLEESWDYLRVHHATRVEDISGNTSFTDVDWDTNDEVETDSYAHSTSVNPDEITLKGSSGKHFLVTANVSLNQDAASANRQNYEMRLALDGIEIPGTITSAYIRGDANSNGIFDGTLTFTGIITKSSSSDQILTIQVRRESAGSTPGTVDIVDGKTALSIASLPDTAEYIRIGDSTGTQALSTTRTPLYWNQNYEVDSGSFSHSTSANTDQVNIDANGDFLFLSTVYTTRSSTGSRDPHRADWQLDGSSLLQYGGHGAYNRGDQGTYDAFTAGSSGGLILPGLTDTQYVDFTAIDESTDAVNVTFGAGQIALQGVRISTLFPPPTYTLSAFRWYTNNDQANPTDPWGNPDLAESTILTALPAKNNPPRAGEDLRLRLSLTVGTSDLIASDQQFKLQYKTGTDSDCTTGSWANIGASGSGTPWRFTSSTSVIDGASINRSLSISDIDQVYSRSNPTISNTNPTPKNQDMEYDFHINHNAAAATTYSFRLVDSASENPISDYLVCPTLTTAPGTSLVMRHGNFFANGLEKGYFWVN